MSKELNSIEKNIMNKIQKGNVKMRPKIYFILGTILSLIGIITSFIVTTFIFGIIRFYLRSSNGKMAEYKLNLLLENFPWWMIFIAIASLTLGIYLFKKYKYLYKIKTIYLILGFILTTILAGILIDISGFNDVLYKRGYIRQFIQQNQTQDFSPNWRKIFYNK